MQRSRAPPSRCGWTCTTRRRGLPGRLRIAHNPDNQPGKGSCILPSVRASPARPPPAARPCRRNACRHCWTGCGAGRAAFRAPAARGVQAPAGAVATARAGPETPVEHAGRTAAATRGQPLADRRPVDQRCDRSGIYLLPGRQPSPCSAPFQPVGRGRRRHRVALRCCAMRRPPATSMNPAAATCMHARRSGRFRRFRDRLDDLAEPASARPLRSATRWPTRLRVSGPWADAGLGRIAVIVVSLGFLTGINIHRRALGRAYRRGAGDRQDACRCCCSWPSVRSTSTPQLAFSGQRPDPHDLQRMGEAALLLLYATRASRTSGRPGEYRNPPPRYSVRPDHHDHHSHRHLRRGAGGGAGTLAGLSSSATPLADAAAGFGGEALALILTVGATHLHPRHQQQPMMMGHASCSHWPAMATARRSWPRCIHVFHTPAASILCQG